MTVPRSPCTIPSRHPAASDSIPTCTCVTSRFRILLSSQLPNTSRIRTRRPCTYSRYVPKWISSQAIMQNNPSIFQNTPPSPRVISESPKQPQVASQADYIEQINKIIEDLTIDHTTITTIEQQVNRVAARVASVYTHTASPLLQTGTNFMMPPPAHTHNFALYNILIEQSRYLRLYNSQIVPDMAMLKRQLEAKEKAEHISLESSTITAIPIRSLTPTIQRLRQCIEACSVLPLTQESCTRTHNAAALSMTCITQLQQLNHRIRRISLLLV